MNMFYVFLLGTFVAFNILALGFLRVARRAKVRVKELEEAIPSYTERAVRIAARKCLAGEEADAIRFRFTACIFFAFSLFVPAFIFILRASLL